MADKMVRTLLTEREKVLEKRSVYSVADALGRLSSRWLDKRFAFRLQAVERLTDESGFSKRMAEEMLDALFSELTVPRLKAVLRAELGDGRVLDGFRFDRQARRLRRAAGPRLVTHVLSSNVPQPSVTSLVFGLLVKSANVCKVSSRDRGILDIYLESLKAADRSLAAVNLLLKATDREGLYAAIAASDVVAAYGDDDTLAEIRRRVPARAVFSGYGDRLSFSLYARDAFHPKRIHDLARRTALDVWMADQRGCLSPLVVFAEKKGGAAPREFARLLAAELEVLRKKDSSPVRRDERQAAVTAGFRSLAHVRKISDPFSGFWESSPPGVWAVRYDEKKTFGHTGCGVQTVSVKGVAKWKDVWPLLEGSERRFQAVALEGIRDKKEVLERLAALGVTRVCRAGRLQYPPLTWHHDGYANLASWVRWTDAEI